MLWVRAIVCSMLIPGTVAILIPLALTGLSAPLPGAWRGGWILLTLGVGLYVRCLRNFVRAGGTPAMFLTGSLSSVIGREPRVLVQNDIYGTSRNPMYLSVLLVVIGQAIAFASIAVAAYCVVLGIALHLAVTRLEEPHLRAREPIAYDRYARAVPRWLSLPRRKAVDGSKALQPMRPAVPAKRH